MDSITTIIRTEVVLIMLQMTTGISNRKVTRNNNNALAVCLIIGPE